MYANLQNSGEAIDTGNDTIVIVHNDETLRGGRTLDVVGFAPTVIKGGHVIIRETTGALDYKPLPVTGTLPADHEYAGILVSTILTAKPFASIMVRGTVNPNAAPYAIAAEVKTALPLIRFSID